MREDEIILPKEADLIFPTSDQPKASTHMETHEFRTAGELQELEEKLKAEGKIILYRYHYSLSQKVIIVFEIIDKPTQPNRIVSGFKPLDYNQAVSEVAYLLARKGKIPKDKVTVFLDPDVVLDLLYKDGYVLAKRQDVKQA